MSTTTPHWSARLPFYYGWVIVAIGFVTMAIAATARTSFSLLLPPLIHEFGWNRGLVAGAFSFGFLVSAALSPMFGRVMDRHGPQRVIGVGVCLMTAGLFLAPFIATPWQLYATLGVLVGGGANLMTYSAHSQFLPNWFIRRRALAISVVFTGAGVGAIILLPWLQTIIDARGWRASCIVLGVLVAGIIGPLTFLMRHKPADVGALPDGVSHQAGGARRRTLHVVDTEWASIDWTLARAMRTARFWWISVGYFCALFAWYAVQVHQTEYLIEVGFSPMLAAWALGFVNVVAIPGQVGLGALSDRMGREWLWTIGCAGFAVCYAALIALAAGPSLPLLYLMVGTQGFLGYALPSVMGPIVAEIYEGRHFGAIFGAINVTLIGGGAAGPWVAGVIHDGTGSYRLAFLLAILCCFVSTLCVWMAAPRKVRTVAGRAPR